MRARWRARGTGSCAIMLFNRRDVLISALVVTSAMSSCSPSSPQSEKETSGIDAVQGAGEIGRGDPNLEPSTVVYEAWNDESGLLHRYYHGLDIFPGHADDAKYLERSAVTPWLAPEYITTEQAEGDELKWAGGKTLRWLSGTMATFHFPFYPEDWDGELYVEIELRPKVNPSGAVRFYVEDESGKRAWSQPLTADFSPGWNGYRWRLSRERLARDGMQLMRVSFPGSYFEGDKRVSAKFVRVGITNEKRPTGRYDVGSFPPALREAQVRLLSQAIEAYPLSQAHRLERFFIVPDQAKLEFSVAPSPYLETKAALRVEISADGEKKVDREIALAPGARWIPQSIDLSDYAQKAVRIAFVPEIPSVDDGFSSPPIERPKILLAAPQIVLQNDAVQNKLKNSQGNPTATRGSANTDASSIRDKMRPARIVVIAVDNLRADRLTATSKRRATPELSKIYDAGVSGVVMASGMSLATTVASFLTTLPPDVHGVDGAGTHLRTSLTTLPEAMHEKQWHTEFYSTSSIADAAKGFAQGFDVVHALNRENVVASDEVLERVASALAQSQPKSLFFVHLSELRLPYKAPAEKMALWGTPGYTGSVSPMAMQNIIVKQNPSDEDAQQLEAYYDGELSTIDEAVGAFVRKLPDDTLVVIWGTHGNSLGESHLGYELTLSPWELLTPYVFWMPNADFAIRQSAIARPETLSATILDIAQVSAPAHAQSIFEPHDPRPQADSSSASATASRDYFYRLRREGVDVLYSTGLNGDRAAVIDKPAPILRQAMRERIE